MVEPVMWPATLIPANIQPNIVPFSRGGGRSLGGLQRTVRTDRGWWSVAYRGIALRNTATRRDWNATRSWLVGMAGLAIVPVWSHDAVLWPAGTHQGLLWTVHSDGTPHSDTTPYAQQAVVLEMAEPASIGDTTVTLRILAGLETIHGIRFSYQHALYETTYGTAGDEDGVWTTPIFPAIRADIPADAQLEVAQPTCMMHLASDREMDTSFTAGHFDRVDVAFVEAVDYWSDLAVGEGS